MLGAHCDWADRQPQYHYSYNSNLMCEDMLVFLMFCMLVYFINSIFPSHPFNLFIFQLIPGGPPAFSLLSPRVGSSLCVGAGSLIDTGRDKATFHLAHLIVSHHRFICEHTHHLKIYADSQAMTKVNHFVGMFWVVFCVKVRQLHCWLRHYQDTSAFLFNRNWQKANAFSILKVTYSL